MRCQASNAEISDCAYDAHHSRRIAADRRANRQPAELVYTTAEPDAANPEWVSAEAYETGHSAGEQCANYAQAYENADETTKFNIEVPSRFSGQDEVDYRTGFEGGVSDFWDDNQE
ncbi:hypothetical protein H8Z59_24575 [Mycolicibacterium fortuitum]|uniref:hypothetical protein n=1 Tax=Mycolicibacterium fortuitum TaxID=1766 RepID=UPI001CDCD72B|nr:hypothetical protein [Mycolicibacterium fortuitum]UBV20411.1 hypothetical protein H8Z59_24575 [Mycolicibacterium fortuitum]